MKRFNLVLVSMVLTMGSCRTKIPESSDSESVLDTVRPHDDSESDSDTDSDTDSDRDSDVDVDADMDCDADSDSSPSEGDVRLLCSADALIVGDADNADTVKVRFMGDFDDDGSEDFGIFEVGGDLLFVDDPIVEGSYWKTELAYATAYNFLAFGPAGDINRDGFDDLFADEVFHGPLAGDYLVEWSDAPTFGFSAQGRHGDMSGDGLDDLLLGHSSDHTFGYGKESKSSAGSLSVYFEEELDDPDIVIYGEMREIDGMSSGLEFGSTVEQLGDMNGDGIGEFLGTEVICSYDWCFDLYRTWIYDAATTGVISYKSADATIPKSALFETQVDWNGDGYDDIGTTPFYSSDVSPTNAVIYFGPIVGDLDAEDADITFVQEDEGGSVMYGPYNPGDIDGDGAVDVLTQSRVGENPFSIRLFMGPLESGEIGSTEAAMTFIDPNGESSSSAGGMDLDKDGFSDLVFGNDTSLADGGVYDVVYIFSGANLFQ